MEASVIAKLIEASPFLGFILLFLWYEAKRDDKRVENAEKLETRRENHEKAMQEKQLKHDNDVNSLWAAYIQQIVNEIKVGNQALLEKMEEHDTADGERYKRLEITQNLFKAAQEKTRRDR